MSLLQKKDGHSNMGTYLEWEVFDVMGTYFANIKRTID